MDTSPERYAIQFGRGTTWHTRSVYRRYSDAVAVCDELTEWSDGSLEYRVVSLVLAEALACLE
jgi:hypothetical protein